jgi:hypothetical protein
MEGIVMKGKLLRRVQIMMVIGILLSFLGGFPQRVQAATCTWTGFNNNWYDVDNWSGCLDESENKKVPGGTDDVVLPAHMTKYPILTINHDNITINSLTINAGASLTIDENMTIIANQFNNFGTVVVEDVTGHTLKINAPFNNHDTVNFGTKAGLALYQSGSHSGSFSGRYFSFPNLSTGELNTFQTGSSIDVYSFNVGTNRTVTVEGQISWQILYLQTDSSLNISAAQTINAGEVVFHGGTLIANSLSIPNGETFSGEGTLQSNLINSGMVSPGSSPGILTIDGVFTQESNGSLAIEIGGDTPDSEHDQLLITGAASLDGTLDVTLINDFSPELGDSFSILTYTSHSGTFSTVNLPALDAGLSWQVAYNPTGIVLSVIRSGGSISGTVTYTGNKGLNPVSIALFEDYDDPPIHTIDVTSATGSYVFTLDIMLDGIYYVAALMDLNGNNQSDPDEPFNWYDDNNDGTPNSIVVISGNSITDVDFTLKDPQAYVYLPLIIH